jgi:transcriptional regulator with XRE-family HTH domain
MATMPNRDDQQFIDYQKFLTDDDLSLGAWLREVRRRAKLSQRELAAVAGIALRTLDRLESGEITNPRLRTLDALARAGGCFVAIVDGDGNVIVANPQDAVASDRAGRRFPAHLRVRRTWGRDWWGWPNHTYGDPDVVPTYTFDLRKPDAVVIKRLFMIEREQQQRRQREEPPTPPTPQ